MHTCSKDIVRRNDETQGIGGLRDGIEGTVKAASNTLGEMETLANGFTTANTSLIRRESQIVRRKAESPISRNQELFTQREREREREGERERERERERESYHLSLLIRKSLSRVLQVNENKPMICDSLSPRDAYRSVRIMIQGSRYIHKHFLVVGACPPR
jgi:hypothetical protein